MKSSNKFLVGFIIVFIITVMITGGIVGFFFMKNRGTKESNEIETDQGQKAGESQEVTIIPDDTSGLEDTASDMEDAIDEVDNALKEMEDALKETDEAPSL